IPLRPNLFCPWLLAPIHNWHHQGSNTPIRCTTSCAHKGKPQCSTSVSGQTPLVTNLHLRPMDRAIKQEDWEHSNQLCMLKIKYTRSMTQPLYLWNTS
ncbi:hypothetical protein K5549_022100, partial [Capra hircus]